MRHRRFTGSRAAMLSVVLGTALLAGATAPAQGSRNPQLSNQQQGQMQAEPSGWVMIAYDYDQDGQVDAYEYIFRYDLEQARQMSRQRPQGQQRTQRRSLSGGPMQQQRMQPGRGQPSMRQDWSGTQRQQFGPSQRQQQRMDGATQTGQLRINGRVQDLTAVRLSGQRERHVFAKIQTAQGRTVVADLGPTGQVNDLDIFPGDLIQLTGTPARVNQRQVIMASEVRANDQRITNPRMRGSRTTRLQGRIVRTATRDLEGPNQPAHVIALIALDNGRRVPVDLGRQRDLREQGVQIRSGQDIVLLAQPFNIGNRRILTAETISVNGRQIDVNWLAQATTVQQQVRNW